jgi:hypothetical protein
MCSLGFSGREPVLRFPENAQAIKPLLAGTGLQCGIVNNALPAALEKAALVLTYWLKTSSRVLG